VSGYDDIDEPVHLMFGLSYAQYLVLNRTLLQSMPVEWQRKFCPLVEELWDSFVDVESAPEYTVLCLAREREHIGWELCEACEGEGEIVADGVTVGPCEECDGKGQFDADRWETHVETGTITDPIPPYSRGRTRVPLSAQRGRTRGGVTSHG
jgi:hypothetical protein